MLFLGALLSVCVSGALAVSQLMVSGISISSTLLTITSGIFLVAGVLEGAITVAVVRMIEGVRPVLLKQPARLASRNSMLGTGAMLLVAVAGTWMASNYPDGLERLGDEIGLRAKPAWLHSPFPDYEVDLGVAGWMQKSVASFIGLTLTYVICAFAARRSRLARDRETLPRHTGSSERGRTPYGPV